MTTIPRREIGELVTLHEKEPSLRDLVVEGVTDKHFFEWYLNERGLHNVSVYESSAIEIPDHLLLDAGLDNGARSRVIALAGAVANQHPTNAQLTCIVDADFDFIEGVRRESPLLLLTDFTSVEVYAFNVRVIDKILKLVVKGFRKTASALITEIATPLQEIFLLRAASHVEKLGLDFNTPNGNGFYKCLEVKADRLEFNREKYITSLLQSNRLLAKRNQLLDRVAGLRNSMAADPRFQIHGHDFEHALSLYVRRHKGFGKLSPDTLRSSILTSLEIADLDNENLFRNLVRRAMLRSA
jgi:hypothetical protein